MYVYAGETQKYIVSLSLFFLPQRIGSTGDPWKHYASEGSRMHGVQTPLFAVSL